jgi:hypothetical protein
MRISERIVFALILGATSVAVPASAFDGAPANQDAAIPMVVVQPGAGAAAAIKKAVPTSTPDTSLTSLQYAAEGGHPIAQWKLGRMYANGDGVTQDDLRAFEYFSRIANAHAEDNPSAPQSAIVANAFVALGRYYLNGIPNSTIKSDPERAREMFSYAAPISAMPTRNMILPGSICRASVRHGMTSAMARAGSALPPRRASIRPRPCLVRCCSMATSCRARPPAD